MRQKPDVAILVVIALAVLLLGDFTNANERPNILFIFSDDHAVNAISAYEGPLAQAAPTPNIDRIAREGALFRNSFCANSICGPSRACILTGKHSHKNGFMRNTGKGFDQSQWTVAKSLQAAGYQTAVIGKWHLKTHPVAFDHWEIFPGQGSYYNPVFIQKGGKQKQIEGYATDLTTNKSIDWLESRDKSKPFFLMCQHKAPHRTFAPALRHLGSLDNVDIPEPKTLFDSYANRSGTLATNEMEVDRHLTWAYDLKLRNEELDGVKLPEFRNYGTPEYKRMTDAQRKEWDAHFGPKNKEFITAYKAGKIDPKKLVQWKYQRYIQNYLECVKAVDDSVGQLLSYLDENNLADNTVVIYSSDQGFYLGEHGWFDKRWMFEESFKMPFAIRWPGTIKPGSRPEALIQNIDYAPTFLEIAGESIPTEVQGKSLMPILKDESKKLRDSLYYGYYELGEHAVPQHFGVRTRTHKLFYLPETNEWQMFDLVNDPNEMVSLYGSPNHTEIQSELKNEYHRLRRELEAPPYENLSSLRKK
ncbi:MAG: sulfatase [Mariniblastus sp.]|nr:sulfatase [Mariniblastus sp.]